MRRGGGGGGGGAGGGGGSRRWGGVKRCCATVLVECFRPTFRRLVGMGGGGGEHEDKGTVNVCLVCLNPPPRVSTPPPPPLPTTVSDGRITERNNHLPCSSCHESLPASWKMYNQRAIICRNTGNVFSISTRQCCVYLCDSVAYLVVYPEFNAIVFAAI